MKKIPFAIALFISMSIIGCKDANEENEDLEGETEIINTVEEPEITIDEEDEEEMETLVVKIEPKSGSNLSGTATFTEEAGGVTLNASLAGLTEGTHAMHIHEKGDCATQDASSAGGHWNPTFEQHGEWGDEKGFHRGDIGNFETAADGTANFTFSTDLWCIGCGDEKKDILGKAVIVHDGVDDYTSQPSGAAGNRIGCGVIVMEGAEEVAE